VNAPPQHYLILANGAADFATPVEWARLAAGRFTIALDGAANLFHRQGFLPDLALGDFDSLAPAARAFLESAAVPLLHRPCQDSTDLEKALLFIEERNGLSTVVANGLGGRQDHALANVFYLKKYGTRLRNLSLITAHGRLLYRENCTETFRAAPDSPCGFFGLPRATVTSRGLRYEMEDYPLELGTAESVANSFLGEEISLRIAGQCLLSLPLPSDGLRLPLDENLHFP
jgi:thiamine pyrophosphokinase